MKKMVYALSMLLFVLLSACQGSKDEAQQMQSLSLQARMSVSDSRTSFAEDENGLYRTSWVAGDELQVLFANDAETESYRFTLNDPSLGEFSCSAVELDAAAEYDVLGVYPATSVVDAQQLSATLTVGSTAQTQQSASPGHIAQYDPLWGSSLAADIDNITLSMHHTASVIEFQIENLTDADVVVESVVVEAEQPIVADFEVDLQSEEVTALQDAESLSNVVTLDFQQGELVKDGVLKAWVAVAPFVALSGESLKFTVYTTEGDAYCFEKQFAAEVSFSAGKVKQMTDKVVLSSQSLKREPIELNIDLTSAATYPASFPTTKTSFEGAVEYVLDGEKFIIESTKPYSCGSAKDKLRFYFNNGGVPAEDDYALIYLPVKEGYRLSEVEVVIDSGVESNKFRTSIASTVDLQSAITTQRGATNLKFTKEGWLSEPSGDVQYCININFADATGVKTTNCNCYIEQLVVAYEPL